MPTHCTLEGSGPGYKLAVDQGTMKNGDMNGNAKKKAIGARSRKYGRVKAKAKHSEGNATLVGSGDIPQEIALR